jgi:acyl carrier protein
MAGAGARGVVRLKETGMAEDQDLPKHDRPEHDRPEHDRPEHDRIVRQVAVLMGRVFGVDPQEITEATTPADIARWDSLSMLTVLIGVERRLQVVIPPEALQDMRSVGDLVAAIKAAGATS